MCAAPMKQSRPPAAIAENNEVFAQYLQVPGPRSYLRRERDRVPIPTHILAPGRSRTRLHESGVVPLRATTVPGCSHRLNSLALRVVNTTHNSTVSSATPTTRAYNSTPAHSTMYSYRTKTFVLRTLAIL